MARNCTLGCVAAIPAPCPEGAGTLPWTAFPQKGGRGDAFEARAEGNCDDGLGNKKMHRACSPSTIVKSMRTPPCPSVTVRLPRGPGLRGESEGCICQDRPSGHPGRIRPDGGPRRARAGWEISRGPPERASHASRRVPCLLVSLQAASTRVNSRNCSGLTHSACNLHWLVCFDTFAASTATSPWRHF